MKPKFSFFLLFIVLTHTLWAQNNELYKKIKEANPNTDLSYNYKVLLWDMKTKKVIDSTSGSLYTKNGQYLDSNTMGITARSGNYFCNLDHKKKKATVCDMILLNKRRGIDRNKSNDTNNLATLITDTLLARGNYSIDSSNKLYYRLKIQFNNRPIGYAHIDVRKDNYKMLALYFEKKQMDDYDPKNTLLYTYSFTNMKPIANDKIFDLKRFFTLAGQKITLSPKYSKYTLTPLVQ